MDTSFSTRFISMNLLPDGFTSGHPTVDQFPVSSSLTITLNRSLAIHCGNTLSPVPKTTLRLKCPAVNPGKPFRQLHSNRNQGSRWISRQQSITLLLTLFCQINRIARFMFYKSWRTVKRWRGEIKRPKVYIKKVANLNLSSPILSYGISSASMKNLKVQSTISLTSSKIMTRRAVQLRFVSNWTCCCSTRKVSSSVVSNINQD
jgi:hypothetical protein